MDALTKIRNRLAAIDDEQQKMVSALEADESRTDFTDDEKTRFAALKTEKKALQEREVELAEFAASQQTRPARRAAGSNTPAPHIAVDEPNFTKDPMKGFKNPREFLGAVMDAGIKGATKDQRLQFLATAGSDEQSTFSDSYGGFFVPEGMSPSVLQLEPEPDPIGGRTTRIPMATTSVKFNARVDKSHSTSVSGGLTVTRRPEAGSMSAGRQQWEQVKLEAFSLYGLAYATEELLTDSPISFAALLAAGFQDEFTANNIDERINGTGVGEFLGIMKCPALITVNKETGQTADTIVYDNLVKMYARCWRPGNAIWMANHNCLPQFAKLNQTVGTGGTPIWSTDAREGFAGTLLGLPLVLTEYCETIGDLGDIILANWSQYLEGVYQPLQSAESIHVRFTNHERTFKFWLRNAGAPWWKSALTPKNGDTLSPFVTLQAR